VKNARLDPNIIKSAAPIVAMLFASSDAGVSINKENPSVTEKMFSTVIATKNQPH